jgi:prepilin signal peptidase PulO-like enzyme (type II secretory pathway)
MALIIVFIFGLIIGSFLNVLIWRFYTGESAIKGRSYCPKCKHRLDFFDLFPVMSFVVQGGKCRYCRGAISWQYPIVELATAVLFAATYIICGFFASGGPAAGGQFLILLKDWFVISVMIVIFVYDAKHYLILDKVIYPAVVVVFIASPLLGLENSWWRGVLDGLLAAAIGGGFFLLQYVVSKGKWIGGGDVKMGFLMGLILGIKGLLVALFFSYIIGALAGLVLIALRRKKMKSQIPFGMFLAVGTIIAMFWGEKILRWYLG